MKNLLHANGIETPRPLVNPKDLVIQMLYHELVRAEGILNNTGLGGSHPNSMLFIRSAISSAKKYLT